MSKSLREIRFANLLNFFPSLGAQRRNRHTWRLLGKYYFRRRFSEIVARNKNRYSHIFAPSAARAPPAARRPPATRFRKKYSYILLRNVIVSDPPRQAPLTPTVIRARGVLSPLPPHPHTTLSEKKTVEQ